MILYFSVSITKLTNFPIFFFIRYTAFIVNLAWLVVILLSNYFTANVRYHLRSEWQLLCNRNTNINHAIN